MFGPDNRNQPERGTNDGFNTHILTVRHVVIEAVGKSVGKLMATMLSAVLPEEKKSAQILYYRTTPDSAGSFLSPVILAGFKSIDKPAPQLDISELTNSCSTAGLSGQRLEAEIRTSRENDLKSGKRLLAGSQGADIVFFDTILGAGSSSHARKEIDAAFSLVRPGGYLVYLHDSAIVKNSNSLTFVTTPGAEKDAFIVQSERAIRNCMVNAGEHLARTGIKLDYGNTAGESQISTPVLRQRLSAYLKLSPLTGDLSAFFTFAGLAAVEKRDKSIPSGVSTVGYSGHILFARKPE